MLFRSGPCLGQSSLDRIVDGVVVGPVLDRHIEHGRRVERTGKDINEPEIGNLDAGDRDTEAGGASMKGSSPGIFADGSHDEAPGSHGETLLSDRLYVLFDRSLNGVPLVTTERHP